LLSRRLTQWSSTTLVYVRAGSVVPRLPDVAAILLLILQPLVFFRKVLFYPSRHIPYDIQGWHFPLASVLARGLRLHDWPLWDPGQYCGMPYFANIQTQQYYPPALIAILLGNAHDQVKAYYYYEWLVPVHMIIAGLFAYGLFRHLGCAKGVALFGATVFQLGAFFASQATHLGAVCCAAWLPLCVWALFQLSEKITAMAVGLLSLGITLCILSGFPAAIFPVAFTLLVLGAGLCVARLASWRVLGALVVSFFIGAMATMVQLAPSLVLTRLSIAVFRSKWFETPGGLPLASLASFVLPDHFHYLAGATDLYKLPYGFTWLHTYCGYAAVVLLLLIPVARHSKLVWISVFGLVISTIVMLGSNAHIYSYVHRLLPPLLRGSLYCEYFLLPFTWFVALTAALSLNRLLELRKLRSYFWIGWVVAILTGIDLLLVGSETALNSAPGSYRYETTAKALLSDQATVRKLRGWVDRGNPPARIDFVRPEQTELRSRAELLGFQSGTGDDPFMLLRFYDLRTIFTKSGFWERIKPIVSLRSPWIDALNIGLLAQNNTAPELPEGEVPSGKYEVAELPALRIYRNNSPLPRFYFVSRVRRAPDEKHAVSMAADPSFDPANEAIVEGLSPEWQGGTTADSSTVVTGYSNNAVRLETSSSSPLFLVSSEASYPGWLATIDGVPASLYETNVAFRGLPVPAGKHTVSMRFKPEHFRLWLGMTFLGLMGIAGLVAWPRKYSADHKAQGESALIKSKPLRIPKIVRPKRPAIQIEKVPYLKGAWIRLVAVAILIYLAFGIALMRAIGVEADEAIFVPLLANAKEAAFWKSILDHAVPLMSMTYLGALKWWLYKPIFAIAGMSVISLRVPMLLIAAGTLFLLGGLLYRLSGARAAFFVALLLATDRNFLFTTACDWGPVVLQMFFQVAALTCLVRWYDTKNRVWLVVAGLAVGLGFWDKALFVWFFSALCLAALVFAWQAIYKVFSFDRLACFIFGFVIGAYPLLLYNIEKPNVTLKESGHFSLSYAVGKAAYLAKSVNGDAILLVDTALPSRNQVLNLSTKVDRWTRTKSSGRFYLLILLVPLSLFFCRGPVRLWIIVLFAAGWIGWFESAITKDAGGSPHHQVLFYPLWFAALGLSAGVLAQQFGRVGRLGYAIVLSAGALVGAFQLNTSLVDFSRYSDATPWTDATPKLAEFLRSRPGTRIFILDWGIRTPLEVAFGLDLPATDLSFEISGGRFHGGGLDECVAGSCLAIAHVPGREIFAGAEQKFVDSLASTAMTARRNATIADTKGVPVYDVLDILPAAPRE